MILPNAEWRQREGLDRLMAVLGAAEDETRFVGGCVRDTLLGLPVKDVDCATRLSPQEVVARLEAAGIKAVPTGLAHGTITAVIHHWPVEITTLRKDVETDGRHATIAFTNDWREDAARRDFTINALYADPQGGAIHDYFGGLSDLDAGIVRFIGSPRERIAEDHLRILRYFRFLARFNSGAPDPQALDACAEMANSLMALSRERIADELLKLLRLEDPSQAIALMLDKHIFRPVLPEIEEEGDARLRRLIARERLCGVAADPIRRLAALLPQDPDMAEQIGARLKLSNNARRQLRLYAAPPPTGTGARRLAFTTGNEDAMSLLLLGPAEDAELASALSTLEGWQAPRFPLSGGDLIAMGLTPGPVVAQTLNALRGEWVEADFPAEPWTSERARSLVDQAARTQAKS